MWTAAAALGVGTLAIVFLAGLSPGSVSVGYWVVASAIVLATSIAMVGDAIYDLVKPREHKTADVARLLLIGFLGLSWFGSGPTAAFSADVVFWIVGVGGYLLAVATAAAAWDLVAPPA